MFMLAGDTEDGKKHWFVNFRPWDLKLAFESYQHKKADEAFTSWNGCYEGWIGTRQEIKGEAKEDTDVHV